MEQGRCRQPPGLGHLPLTCVLGLSDTLMSGEKDMAVAPEQWSYLRNSPWVGETGEKMVLVHTYCRENVSANNLETTPVTCVSLFSELPTRIFSKSKALPESVVLLSWGSP